MDLGAIYDFFMIKPAVPQTRGWLLVDSPLPIFVISVIYLYFIFYAGPRYMKDRPLFNLKAFVLSYNLFQVLINAWFVKEYISSGWFTEYSLICNYPSDLNKPSALKLITISWWLFVLKIFDYIETVIFVLRKKQNQVSALHVYHHITVVLYGWLYFKYGADERLTYICLFNCAVHVCMYMYYFVAAWSTEFQQMVSPIKPYITKLQMIQLVMIILPFSQLYFSPLCKPREDTSSEVHWLLLYIFLINILIFVYLFYNFYKKTYSKSSKQKKSQ